VRHAASTAKLIGGTEIELLNVQDPVLMRDHVAMTVQDIEHMQADEAGRVLHAARQVLDAEGVPYQVRRRCGAAAAEIARQVDESHCDAVVMGTRGLGPVAGLVIGSVAMRVVHLVGVPVTLIK